MKRTRWSEWLTVLILAAAGGLALWYELSRQTTPVQNAEPAIVNAPLTNPAIEISEAAIAYRYATAVQEGRCEDILALTWWMRERLARVAAEGPEAESAERERLCRSMTERRIERNRLTPEGVGDEYVFSPGSVIEAYSHDEGRSDLAKPAARRIWFRVTYPSRERALLDEAGLPLRSVVVGINVSSDGYILKANVNGNLDIDRDSADTNWQL